MTNTNTTEQQPTIKWEIETWGKGGIEPVKVVKESAKTLWIESTGRRGGQCINQRRKTNDFHDTWEAAHNELFRRANENVERQLRELDRAQSKLGEIVNMKPPAAEARP